MCVPLAWILAGAGLGRFGWPRFPAAWACAVALAVAENLAYLGNPLSFTNAAVWPKRQAFRLLADSNLDWGQNDDKIGAWMAAEGIPESRLDPLHLLPGPNVLTANAAAGVFDFEQHRWLREHKDPVAHFSHTHLRFDVSDEESDRYMNEERRLLPDAAVAALCPDGLLYESKQPGGQVALQRDTPPEPSSVFVACVKTALGVDLGYRVRSGALRVGHVTSDRRCATEHVVEGKVAWWRLEPGTHALCAVEIPNRRPYLPYRHEGAWVVRGHAAAINVRALLLDSGGTLPLP
jgi:hypothetical protein